jgi:hypothetical protein
MFRCVLNTGGKADIVAGQRPARNRRGGETGELHLFQRNGCVPRHFNARSTNAHSLQTRFEFPLLPRCLVDDPPQKGKDSIRPKRRNVVLER